jgi:protein-disulfide isomerase
LSKESKILTAVLIAVVGGMIGLFALANNNSTDSGPEPSGDPTKVIRDNTPKRGAGAVQLVEFGDFQCPACGAAEPNVQRLLQEYEGKVTFYFRNFPLTQIHRNATAAHNAAAEAGAQGKFWEYHDKLYAAQKEWSDLSDPTDKFVQYAKDLGLDSDKVRAAVDDEKYKAQIAQDVADGNALNVNSTPTFFINGTQITGGYQYDNLKAEIDKALGTAASPAAPAASAAPAQ